MALLLKPQTSRLLVKYLFLINHFSFRDLKIVMEQHLFVTTAFTGSAVFIL